MLEKITNNFSIQDNQLIISEFAQRYQLSSLEYISLINILMYYYSISTSPNTIGIVQLVCEKIIEYRDKLKLNQTSELFSNSLKDIITIEVGLDRNGTLTNLESLVNEGLVFHSFNSAFFDKINTQGLVVKDKPWSLEDIEQIRQIFQRKNNNNIFGMYKGDKATPVFFADSLASSPYYGLSSPTFFRKFIENKREYFNVFLNRDYETAKRSIGELCIGLNSEDKATVFNFFNKYWSEFTNGELPYVAISTKERLGIENAKLERFPNEELEQYYLRCLLSSHNHMIREDVSRDKLDLFSYSELSFTPKTKEKNI